MNNDSIFVATPDAQDYANLIKEHLGSEHEIAIALSPKETEAKYHNQPIVLCRPDYGAVLLKNDHTIQWIQSTWAGVTPLIKHPIKNYLLTSVKGIFGSQMAEYVIGHILTHELRIKKRKEFQSKKIWETTSSGQFRGKVMGIMGTGSIGKAVAKAAHLLGVRIIGFNTSGIKEEPFERIFPSDAIHEFLKNCDYVVGVLPDITNTNDLLNSETLGRLKDTALVINVGRGNLIDEDALSKMLIAKKLGGAILDVCKNEPLPKESVLWQTPNLTLTGHTAAVSRPNDIVGLFLENFHRFTEQESLNHLVDFDKGY